MPFFFHTGSRWGQNSPQGQKDIKLLLLKELGMGFLSLHFWKGSIKTTVFKNIQWPTVWYILLLVSWTGTG